MSSLFTHTHCCWSSRCFQCISFTQWPEMWCVCTVTAAKVQKKNHYSCIFTQSGCQHSICYGSNAVFFGFLLVYFVFVQWALPARLQRVLLYMQTVGLQVQTVIWAIPDKTSQIWERFPPVSIQVSWHFLYNNFGILGEAITHFAFILWNIAGP